MQYLRFDCLQLTSAHYLKCINLMNINLPFSHTDTKKEIKSALTYIKQFIKRPK